LAALVSKFAAMDASGASMGRSAVRFHICQTVLDRAPGGPMALPFPARGRPREEILAEMRLARDRDVRWRAQWGRNAVG
jgi:hypothetical protein